MGPVSKCLCGKFLGLATKVRVLQPQHIPIWFCSFKCSQAYKAERDRKLRDWLDKQS
jgi:hypothetical protein